MNRNTLLKPHRLFNALALAALLGLSGTSAFAQTAPTAAPGQTVGGRIKITAFADLPPHTYAVSGKAAEFVKDDAIVSALAAQVDADIRHDLATYDIQDRSTLSGLYISLRDIALLRRDYPAALVYGAQVKSFLDKPQEKLTSGVLLRAVILSTQSPGTDFQKTLEANLQTALEALPYDQVQDSLKSSKVGLEMLSEPMLTGGLLAPLDPAMRTGRVSRSTAEALLSAALDEHDILPNKAALLAAYTNVIAEHKTAEKADIWPSRDIALTPSPSLHPVLVGIWDSGVDISLFPDQAWTDTDGTHGIAWTRSSEPSLRLLYPLPAADRQYQAYFKGIVDLEASVDSTDAAAVRAKLASLSQDQVKPFADGLDQYVDYAHGTHVAGIALRGNPAARLVVCRRTITDSEAHTEEDAPPAQAKNQGLSVLTHAKKIAHELAVSVAYFKAHNVPVVNISWHGELADMETAIEQSGVSGTPAEHSALAKQVFNTMRSALYHAMQTDPETLYIIAAGNDDNDVGFTGGYPSSFHLPNVLVVGAVDQAGDQTSFTSFGNVDVYADGFEVDSVLPGGSHAKLSGTSMAAPQVTNLAAKLLAVNPALTVAQVKALIIGTADAREVGPKTVRLINPKKAVAAAETVNKS